MFEKEFRIEIKIKNNVFLLKMEKAGYKTVGEFCMINNISRHLGDYINLKKSHLNVEGDFHLIVKKCADLLNCAPEDLFSESQLYLELKSNKRTVVISNAEMKFMLDSGKDDQKLIEQIIDDEKKDVFLKQALDCLSPREQKIISMRFGLNDYCREHTLEEVGLELGVNRERVSQIVARALRHIRNPNNIKKLKDLLDPNS